MYKIIIMCGGVYDNFEKHKALSIINGEPLIERTIRLLKENGINEYYISSNDNNFKKYTNVLHHTNTYKYENGKVSGYWIDAYYPTNEPTIYLHGDVYYTDEGIKKILNLNPTQNTFIGNEIALNKEHKNWGEPFGWIIVDTNKFHKAIEDTKKLQDEGKLERGYAISWELYRVHYGLDPNKMYILDNTYLVLDNTYDIDYPYQIEELNNKLKENK